MQKEVCHSSWKIQKRVLVREKLPWHHWRVALAGSGACWEVSLIRRVPGRSLQNPAETQLPTTLLKLQLHAFPENYWKSQSQEALGPPRLTVTGFWPWLCNYCVLCSQGWGSFSFLIKKKKPFPESLVTWPWSSNHCKCLQEIVPLHRLLIWHTYCEI